MFVIYPANKTEVLLELMLAVIQQTEPDRQACHLFHTHTILVETSGMRHWLNLQMAERAGIAMNMDFQRPEGFVLDCVRALLGHDSMPPFAPYQRDILCWRIDELMASEVFAKVPACAPARQYWLESGKTNPLKRFQLASACAQIFEQYQHFRPDWLLRWERGEEIETRDILPNGSFSRADEAWQAWLWRAITDPAIQPYRPLPQLQQLAIAAMPAYQGSEIPKQIILFAVNTLAPQTLEFFRQLAQHQICQVHLFYLNPCVAFWGDLSSDKVAARQARRQKIDLWLDEAGNQRNPLLANLGKQGRDFFNMLQQLDALEISAMAQPLEPCDTDDVNPISSQSLLARIQEDILTLSTPPTKKEEKADIHNNKEEADTQKNIPSTIQIMACYSELREVQVLHDYLLHLLSYEKDLRARDILVMCPAIEDYSPYIEAVFRTPLEDNNDPHNPRLPASIADRTLVLTHPQISAFMDLLALPDSRFEINRLLDMIRVPAIARRFELNESDFELLQRWFQAAAIHWGKNARHKTDISGQDGATMDFTWDWGLQRLLLGFAQSDQEQLWDSLLLVPRVQGRQAIILGRFMQFVEQLSWFSRARAKARDVDGWKELLEQILARFFDFATDEQDAYLQLRQAIVNLQVHCANAAYTRLITWSVIREFLRQQFSAVDSSSDFITGQVTFCSMVPMRSIPFKVVAILGMNDGKYPRLDRRPEFDLIAQCHPRQGDRSRREADRYLFLEAILCAREYLYISYQARDIRTNAQRQPSLMVKELVDYLHRYYRWQGVIAQPLHPFSSAVFQPPAAGFNQHWLRLAKQKQAGILEQSLELPVLTEAPETSHLELVELIRFFTDPLKTFCQQRLHLYFEDTQILVDDNEPFVVDSLSAYQIRQRFSEQLLQIALEKKVKPQELPDDALKTSRDYFRASGLLPQSPFIDDLLDDFATDAQILTQNILDQGSPVADYCESEFGQIHLSSPVYWLEQGRQLIFWRCGKRRAQDDMHLWLLHLLAGSCYEQVSTLGLFYDHIKKKTEICQFNPFKGSQTAREYLQQVLRYYQMGLCQPMLLHAELGKVFFEGKTSNRNPQTTWNKAFEGNVHQAGLFNMYAKWLYGEIPGYTDERIKPLQDLYQPLYQARQKT